jgi:hypothetical protein
MDCGFEQRWHKILFKSRSATETLVLVQKAYGNEALNRSNVIMWYSRFGDGRELVEDDERGGCPYSTRTEVNVAAVADLLKNDNRIASRMIESLTIPKIAALRILKEDLGRRKIFFFARQCALRQSCKCLPIFDPKICYNPLSPPPPYSPVYHRQTIFCFPSWKWS